MDQIVSYFSSSQDHQIENLSNLLNEYKKTNVEQLGALEKLYEEVNSEADSLKEKYSKTQDELEGIFAKIDEYEANMDRIERIVENSEKDIAALEEYAYEGRQSVFSSVISAFKFPKFIGNK